MPRVLRPRSAGRARSPPPSSPPRRPRRRISTTADAGWTTPARRRDRLSIARATAGFDDRPRTSTAVFFNPHGDDIVDPTTSDAELRRADRAAARRCLARLADADPVDLVDQDDFVNVGAAGNIVEVRLGGGADRAFTTGSRLEAYGEGGDDELSGCTGLDLLDGGPGDDTARAVLVRRHRGRRHRASTPCSTAATPTASS